MIAYFTHNMGHFKTIGPLATWYLLVVENTNLMQRWNKAFVNSSDRLSVGCFSACGTCDGCPSFTSSWATSSWPTLSWTSFCRCWRWTSFLHGQRCYQNLQRWMEPWLDLRRWKICPSGHWALLSADCHQCESQPLHWGGGELWPQCCHPLHTLANHSA